MARRGRNDIEVAVVGEADFGRARKDAKRDLDRIENDALDVAGDIERAFDDIRLSPELDTAEIRQAVDLAQQLDGMVAKFDVDTDLDEIKQAEQIARSLRAFQGRVDLSVEGREELRDTLGIAEKLEQVRDVKVQVQGRQDLQRAASLAQDLEQTRTVRVNVDDSDIDQIDDALTDAGERGADGIADAIGGIDFDSIGGTAVDELTGALSAAGPWAAAAGAIGVVFGDELAEGISQGFNSQRREAMRAITSGLSPEELAVAGEAAGDAWAAGFGESLPQLEADADTLKSILGDLVSDADMSDLVAQTQVLSGVLGVDVVEAAEMARRSISQGLADDWQDAFNDMMGSTQEFGETGREALEIVSEFGPNFQRFEVDGGRAAQFVAGAFRDGLVPTIDRSAEAFEEFTNTMTDGDAADAVAELGLNFEQLQADVAAGGDRANEAMASVVERLIELDGETQQGYLTNQIFGESLAQVADQTEFYRRMLELLTAETDAYVGKADELTGALEGTQTGFDQLKRDAVDAGEFVGEALNKGVEGWYRYGDAALDGTLAAEALSGALRFLNDETDETEQVLSRALGPTEGLKRGLTDLEGAASGATDDLDLAAEAARDLDAAFAELTGRFDASSSFRRLEDQADRLLASVENLEGGLLNATGEFNRSDPAVRQFEQTLEDMNGTLTTAAQKFADGTIEAEDFTAMQRNLAEDIRVAGREAGLTEDQIQVLIDTYTRVPDSIETDVEADTAPARGDLADFLRTANGASATVRLDADGSFARNELNRFLNLARNSRVSVPISGRSSGGGSVITRRSGGGPASGLVRVGEQGPELLNLGPVKGFVHDATRTASTTGQGDRMVLEIRSGGTRLDDALVEIIRRSVVVRGGGDVQVALGSGRVRL